MCLAQVTRYDILYDVNQLARVTSKPVKAHMGATEYLALLLGRVDRLPHPLNARRLQACCLLGCQQGNRSDNGRSTWYCRG